MDIDKPGESKRAKGLSNVALTTCGIVRSMVNPIPLKGPHHGVIVLVVFPWVIRIGHVERVAFSRLKRPFPVGVVMVIVCPSNNARRPVVDHGKFVEVTGASAVA